MSLICITQGGPGNTFAWSTAPSEDGQFSGEFDSNVLVNGDELTIMNPGSRASAVFKCEVTNLAGSGSNTITITSMIAMKG